MSLFDGYVVVDWSSAAAPATGTDSIWIADWRDGAAVLHNISTRLEAEAWLIARTRAAELERERLFLGFDFAFGYPAGGAALLAGGDWRALWAKIEAEIEEGPKNANNRFAAAGRLNAASGAAEGPFWCYPHQHHGRYNGLPYRKPDGFGSTLPASKRLAEEAAPGSQETWKLSGSGSVGGQALTGIAMLERLRRGRDLAIWPFEYDAADTRPVAVEVFPSLIPPHGAEAVRDAGQLRAMCEAIAAVDAGGGLGALMDAPKSQPAQVCAEEGWIFAAGQADVLQAGRLAGAGLTKADALPASALRYERVPSEIYAQSFATVRSEAKLDRFPADMVPMVIRLIHSCGMVEIADRLAFSEGAFAAGAAALRGGAPVLCDCEMVGSGIIRRYLPAGNDVVVTLNDPSVPARAAEIGNTRSAAAVELWRDHIEGAVVAVGNAPTALFHLLELLDQGWPKPAVILGFPVGFVGAAESKAELAARSRGCEFVALRGRKGGSAMASAAVNALAAGLVEETR